ncbi:MAG: ActD-like protein [Alphaproteobacteria bacterium]|nr:ActD-like protein [Alphaproteobacteria bacterium]
MTRRIPDLLLERYALGELDEARRAEIAARIAEDPETASRLAAIGESNGAVLKAMPPRVFAAAVDERARLAAPEARGFRWGLVAPLLVAAVAVLVAIPVVTQVPGPGLEVTRAKGDAMVFVHRQGKGEPEALRDGAKAGEGDVLQLSYTASGAEFGAILSVDGRGTVTWHLPQNGRRAVRLQPGAGVPLDHSYELDDAPGFERFVLVTGPADFDLQDVEDAAAEWAGHGNLRLDPPLRSTLFTVSKEGAR